MGTPTHGADTALLGWGLLTAWGLVSLTLDQAPVSGGAAVLNATTSFASILGCLAFWAISRRKLRGGALSEHALPTPIVWSCAALVSICSVVNQLLQGPQMPDILPALIQVMSSFAYIVLMFGWFFVYVPLDPQIVEDRAVWSTALCAALILLAIVVPYQAAFALWVCLPLASAACLASIDKMRGTGENTIEREQGRPQPNVASLTGASVVPQSQAASPHFANALGIAICAFTLALPSNLGMFTAVEHSYLFKFGNLGGVALAAALVLWYVSSARTLGLHSLFKILYPIAGAGLFCSSLPSQTVSTVGLGLCTAGQWALYVFIWIHAVESCNNHMEKAVGRYAEARASFDLGGMCAGLCSVGTATLLPGISFPLVYVLFAALAVFTATYTVLPSLEERRPGNIPAGPLPHAPQTSPTDGSGTATDGFSRLIEARTARLAEQHALSEREAQILRYLLRGYSTASIRNELSIAKGTVDTYIQRIYRKCDVHSRQELVELSETA